jgi:peroxiredoxin Q/BCP
MVELRKRKEAPPAPEKPAKKKTGPKSKKNVEKLEDTVEKVGNAVPAAAAEVGATAAGETNGTKPGGPPKAGDTITLEGFGGEVETQDGKPVTLMQLVDESKAGVVLFTYPKASTPGCKSRPSVLISE